MCDLLELRKEIRSRFSGVDSVSHDAEYDAKPDTILKYVGQVGCK